MARTSWAWPGSSADAPTTSAPPTAPVAERVATEDCTTVAAVLTHALGPANLRDDACPLCVRICA
ncbi:hypothetical protein PV350_15645 [Streptomyces sp. PA03-6a]|nr:hypothetical protein [Streptomyces sp. PA03-6a]